MLSLELNCPHMANGKYHCFPEIVQTSAAAASCPRTAICPVPDSEQLPDTKHRSLTSRVLNIWKHQLRGQIVSALLQEQCRQTLSKYIPLGIRIHLDRLLTDYACSRYFMELCHAQFEAEMFQQIQVQNRTSECTGIRQSVQQVGLMCVAQTCLTDISSAGFSASPLSSICSQSCTRRSQHQCATVACTSKAFPNSNLHDSM